MNGKTFEIFRNDEDWCDWDKYIQHVDHIDGLTDEQKELARQALHFLRMPEILGRGFLTHARRENHPLFDYITGTTPWRGKMKWLTRFAQAMKTLQSADNFSERVKDLILKDGSKFGERSSVLEIAYKFHNTGLSPSFDPKVMVLKPRGFTRRLLPFQTMPDLVVIDKATGEEVFIEVSALTWGELKRNASHTYHAIFDLLTHGVLFKRDLYPRARILRVLTQEELKDLTAQIQEAISKARNQNEFVEILVKDTIEMCLAPWQEAERADQWANERGIKDMPVEGPSYLPYDPVRLKNIIRKEQEQLPQDKPGMVIITADWSLLFYAHSYREIMVSLEEVLHEYPQLLGVGVSHTYQSGEEEDYAVIDGPHTIVKRNTTEELIEETVIALNVSSKFNVSKFTIEKLRNAFVVG